MKPQQRKFIVEVKSARRRSAARPASIWGDTNLKALVREAESEAPHLFATVGQDGAAVPGLGTEGSDHDRGAVDGAFVNADPAAGSEGVAGLTVQSEDEGSSRVNADLPAEVPQLPTKRPRPTRVGRRARSKMEATAVPVAADALVALEEENRRLKELLAERLRHENTLLGEMLKRFGAN